MSAPTHVPTIPPAAEAAESPPEQPAEARDSELARYDEFADRVRTLCQESPAAQAALRAGLGKPVTEVPARMHAALLRPGLIRDNTEGRHHADKERAYYAVAALIAARPRAQRLAETRTRDAPESGNGQDAHLDNPAPVTPADPTAPAEGGAGTPEPPGRQPPGKETGDAFRPQDTNLGESFALAVGRRSTDQLKPGAAESRLHLLVRQDLDGVHRTLPSVVRWLSSSGIAPDYACLLRDLTRWRYGRDAVATRWLQAFYRSLHRQEAAAAEQPQAPGTGRPASDATPPTP